MNRICAALLVFLCAGGIARAETVFWDNTTYVFQNDHCAQDNTCDLKTFWMEVAQYKVLIDGVYSYGTKMKAGYKTGSVEALEKYGLVQFVRGCHFSVQLLPDGTIAKSVRARALRSFFGKPTTKHFPHWVIDSDDDDPLYNSYEHERDGRIYLYRWMDGKKETLFGIKKPVEPEVYVVDHPGTAFYIDNVASDLSLEFKMCIYRTGDIPNSTRPENIGFAAPIKCFYWKSSFVYNFDNGEFEIKEWTDSICESPKEEL